MNVDFYFDYGSPTSYLAYARIPGIAERTGVAVRYRPVLLGGILMATGNASPMDNPAKRRWMIADLEYTARHHGLPFAYNPNFPINTLNLMRGAVYSDKMGFLRPFSDAIFNAMWVDRRNLGDVAEIRAVLIEAGLNADAIIQGTQDPAIKEALKQDTATAVERGLFGAPVVFVDDLMFFGQDRLDFVEQAISEATLANAA